MNLFEQFGTENLSPEAIKNYGGKMHPAAAKILDLVRGYKEDRTFIASYKGLEKANDNFSENVKEVLLKEMGINFRNFEIIESDDVNAWAYIPDINSNNPMFEGWREFFGGEAGRKLLGEDSKATGTIDRKKVKLGGAFNKVHCNMGIYTGTIDNLSPEQTTFIIFHEIGHVWSGFEFLVSDVVSNVALAARAQDMANNWDSVDKVTLAKELKKVAGKDYDEEYIETKEGFERFISTHIAKEMNTAYLQEKTFYDEINAEAYADQFATRMGLLGGGSAITDIYTNYDMVSTGKTTATIAAIFDAFLAVAISGSYGFLLISVMTASIGAALIVGIAFSIMALILVGAVEANRIYDTYEDRLTRMKNEMVAALKNTNSKSERLALMESIENINNSIETFNDVSGTFVSRMTVMIIPYMRKQFNAKQFQQSLERLMTNEFYVTAEKFKTIKA